MIFVFISMDGTVSVIAAIGLIEIRYIRKHADLSRSLIYMVAMQQFFVVAGSKSNVFYRVAPPKLFSCQELRFSVVEIYVSQSCGSSMRIVSEAAYV